MKFNWRQTPGALERVLELRTAGRTMGEIAAAITTEFNNPVSRCQIAGVLDRHYEGPPIKYEPQKREPVVRIRKATGKVYVPAAHKDSGVAKTTPTGKPTGVRFIDLGPRSCRWPLGDPQTDAFRFCGEPKPIGCPYCAEHRALAYTPRARKTKEELNELRTAIMQMLRVNQRKGRPQ